MKISLSTPCFKAENRLHPYGRLGPNNETMKRNNKLTTLFTKLLHYGVLRITLSRSAEESLYKLPSKTIAQLFLYPPPKSPHLPQQKEHAL